MLHGINKVKFKHGKDANKMLMRKLMVNFFSNGKMTTTLKKARVMKPQIERLVEKAKNPTEARKNSLNAYFANPTIVRKLIEEIGPALKNVKGGYVRIEKLGMRDSDGSQTARIEWAYPVVKVEKVLEVKKDAKKDVKKETKKV